jgi:dipeptidyl aminopeptidase/acylaminoacyl peptidase
MRVHHTKDLKHVRPLAPITVALLLCLAPLASHAGRPIEPQDWYRFKAVSELQIAPDGGAIAYLVTSYDRESDESVGALWLSDWSGQHTLQLTRGESVSVPRFTPDGRYLSFVSARPAGSRSQLWVVDRRGGEPRQLSHVEGEIIDYDWAPDGKRLVLVMRAGEDAHSPKPLVIDAFHFKEDGEGYLTAESRPHLHLLDVASGRSRPLTADVSRRDTHAAFSPDGQRIAYISNSIAPEQGGRDEIMLLDATSGARPQRLLSTWTPNYPRLQWSADGRSIAFLEGDELKYNQYIMDQLDLVDVKSGEVRHLTAHLDRQIYKPRFGADGRSIDFAIEEDGWQYPARVQLTSGALERLAGPTVVHEIASAGGHTAVLASSDRSPVEAYALEAGQLRPLSAHNAALFAELSLGTVEDLAFPSRDGTQIHGQLVKPTGYQQGRRYPTLVWIHGGPNGQDDHSLQLEGYGPQLERQLFASHGYAVLAINYRGSTGRGAAFARAITADWGHKEVEDLLAGVDHVIAGGIADPQRLGIGGWSYGGLLTDYVVARDGRFRAAISGAGSANQTATYGADEYVIAYNAELGPPWRDTALWMRLSYPFFHADRIHTPTLFMGGDRDFDVPIIGGEQMYQALRTLGVPTQLIVYPGEIHVFSRPSFLVDRSARFLDWMNKYLAEP